MDLKVPAAAPSAAAVAAAVKVEEETKFAGEDECEEEPVYKTAVPKSEQVVPVLCSGTWTFWLHATYNIYKCYICCLPRNWGLMHLIASEYCILHL